LCHRDCPGPSFSGQEEIKKIDGEGE